MVSLFPSSNVCLETVTCAVVGGPSFRARPLDMSADWLLSSNCYSSISCVVAIALSSSFISILAKIRSGTRSCTLRNNSV